MQGVNKMELKFRAWHHGAGNPMYEAHMNYSDQVTLPIFFKNVENEDMAVEVMQFTGVKIHDADLYPGDLIKFDWLLQSGEKYADDAIGVIGEVVQLSDGSVSVRHHGGLSFDARDINQATYERFWKESYNSAADCFQKMVNFEVIGNIHQHSHLLDKGE